MNAHRNTAVHCQGDEEASKTSAHDGPTQLVCIHDNAVRESIRIMVLSGGNVAMQLCAACAADTLMQISLHRVQGHCEGMALA